MKQNNQEFEKTKEMLGNRSAFLLFGGRPELVGSVWRVPETTPFKEWKWVPPGRVVPVIEHYVSRGWQVWLGVNEFVPGRMTIQGVRKIWTLFFDIDAPRRDKTRPATEAERTNAFLRADGLKEYLSTRYGAICFAACSGNGAHVYCPLRPYELPFVRDREIFNERQKAWMRKIRRDSGVDFDNTGNINRLAQPIGVPNQKIPSNPLPTYWLDDFTITDIIRARRANLTLLEEILKTHVELESNFHRAHPTVDFTQLLLENEWLREMYFGHYDRTSYPSRSEAELAVVRELAHFGFSDDEIDRIMRTCLIGKWQEAGDSYHRSTLLKAREWEEKKKRRRFK
ncbi:MAG: hypothetical protein GXO25_08185 [Euryarchaeota archaeon]|nr:hypothetical protein [Euryarchaeota archaeon]